MSTVNTNRNPTAWRSRWAAIGAAVAVTLGAGGMVAVNAASSAPSSFVASTPTRILDTRTDVGLPGPFVSGVAQKLQVTGTVPTQPSGSPTPPPVNAEVVQAGATSVVLNVTVVRPSTRGFISIRPGDATGVPATSNINWGAGGPNIANSVTVQLPTDGTIDIYVQGTVGDVLIDVAGYYRTGSANDDRLGGGANAVTMKGFEVQMSYGDIQGIAGNDELTLSLSCEADDNTPDQAFPATPRNTMKFIASSTGEFMTTYVDLRDLYDNEELTIARALGSSTPGEMVQTTFAFREPVRTAAAVTGADGSQISVDGDSVQVMFNVDNDTVTGGGTVDCYARGIVMMLPPR